MSIKYNIVDRRRKEDIFIEYGIKGMIFRGRKM